MGRLTFSFYKIKFNWEYIYVNLYIFLENYVINSAKLIEKNESNGEDNMGFKSYY